MFSYLRAVLSLLTRRHCYILFGLVILIFFTGLIELVGIGALFPYIKLLGDPTIIEKNHIVHAIYQYAGFQHPRHFLIAVGVGIFLTVFLKGFMTCFNNYAQAAFGANLTDRLSKYCISRYMYMPYLKTIDQNSAILSKHILVDVNYAVLAITSMLTLATDVVTSLFLVVLMLWVDVKLIGLMMGIVSIFLYAALKLTKKKIHKISVDNERYSQSLHQIVMNALQGLKDIHVYHVEPYFIKNYMEWRHKMSHNCVVYSVISNIPATLMNVLGFGVLLIILLYLLSTHTDFVSILPSLGIIAVAVQRLLPATGRVSLALGIIRQYRHNVFVVRDAMYSLASGFSAAPPSVPVSQTIPGDTDLVFKESITLHDVFFTYPGTHRYALEDIHLVIKKNQSLGIVGESGAGKSTLVDVLLGLLPISRGEICCDGQIIHSAEAASFFRHIGYVPQQTYLIDGTIRENIAFGIAPQDADEEALANAIHIAQLEKFIQTLDQGLDTLVGERGVKLSGGQRQRLGIARALYYNPDIIIMDEATNALDAVTEMEFNKSLRILMDQKTVIVIAHRHSSVKFCDHLIVMDNGRIVAQGTHAELLDTSSKYCQLFA